MASPQSPGYHRQVTELFSESNVSFVLRTLLRLGAPKGEAEDLAQEVFIIVHRRASEFDDSKSVQPWLYGIARNLMRAHWRKQGARREELGGSEDVAMRERPQETPEFDDQADMLRQAVSLLSEPLLDVMMLRDFMGMTLPETAKELGIPTDTAKDRLRRARDAVRSKLQTWQTEVDRG